MSLSLVLPEAPVAAGVARQQGPQARGEAPPAADRPQEGKRWEHRPRLEAPRVEGAPLRVEMQDPAMWVATASTARQPLCVLQAMEFAGATAPIATETVSRTLGPALLPASRTRVEIAIESLVPARMPSICPSRSSTEAICTSLWRHAVSRRLAGSHF